MGQRPGRVTRQHRSHSGEARGHIKVHQPLIELSDGRSVLPAYPGVDSQLWPESPVIRQVGIINRLPEVLIGIAVGDRAGVWDAFQEVGEIRMACGNAGKSEGASRILLRKVIELLSAK